MKKLLFINGHLNTGGVEKSLLDILKHLDYEKYEVDLLLLEELGDYASEIPEQVHVQLRCLKNTYGSVPSSLLCCIRQRDWFCFQMRLIFLMMKLFGQKEIRFAAFHRRNTLKTLSLPRRSPLLRKLFCIPERAAVLSLPHNRGVRLQNLQALVVGQFFED